MLKIFALNKSTKIILNYTIGLGLFIWLFFAIYKQVSQQQNLQIAWQQIKSIGHGHKLILLFAVIFLMLINWGIEARKWQILVKPLEIISFKRSFFAVLSGVTLAINTPNRIGEYGGRILYLKHKNKLRGISVTAVGSFSQFLTTLFFGIAGFIFYITHFSLTKNSQYFSATFWGNAVLIILVLIGVMMAMLYFRLEMIITFFNRWRWLRKMQSFVEVIRQFSGKELAIVLLLSVSRYIIFSAQYLILLGISGVEMQWGQAFLMICLSFLVLAILPTIAIAELGIRGQVSLFLLGLLSLNKIGIITATFGIWLINLILPAILGSLLLIGVKIFSDK